MIAFLVNSYAILVYLRIKFKILKPRPFPIAWTLLGGVLLIGGIVVAWVQCAPVSSRVVSTQYVIQLVPYVKGQIRKVYAQPLKPLKKGDLLLEINPEPYEFTLRQVQAQLQSAKDTVQQAAAGVENAEASVAKAKAGVTQTEAALKQAQAGVATAEDAVKKVQAQDELAKTEEQIALNLQKSDPGAISELKVAEAVQKRKAADAALAQALATVNETKAGVQQAEAAISGAKATQVQSEAAKKQADFSVSVRRTPSWLCPAWRGGEAAGQNRLAGTRSETPAHTM
jgi:multidrug resistance efflux pump